MMQWRDLCVAADLRRLLENEAGRSEDFPEWYVREQVQLLHGRVARELARAGGLVDECR